MGKITVIVLLVALAGFGVYRHLNAPPDAMGALMEVPPTAVTDGPGQIQTFVADGDLSQWAVPGRHTIIVGSTTWCPGCRQIKNYLRQFMRMRPDIVVRTFDVDESGGWEHVNQVCDINMRAVPHVMIYGPEGTLLAADDGKDRRGKDVLVEWMNAVRNNRMK